MRSVGQLETAFNAIDSTVKAIKPPMYTGQSFFHRRHSNLPILKIVRHSLGSLVDLAQRDQYNAFGFARHDPSYSAATRTGSGCGLAAY
jgi:hypothetical protein